MRKALLAAAILATLLPRAAGAAAIVTGGTEVYGTATGGYACYGTVGITMLESGFQAAAGEANWDLLCQDPVTQSRSIKGDFLITEGTFEDGYDQWGYWSRATAQGPNTSLDGQCSAIEIFSGSGTWFIDGYEGLSGNCRVTHLFSVNGFAPPTL